MQIPDIVNGNAEYAVEIKLNEAEADKHKYRARLLKVVEEGTSSEVKTEMQSLHS